MAVTYSNDLLYSVQATETLTGAKTLVEGDSGTLFFLKASAGATITLPALKAGLNFKFIVADNFATSNWVIDSAEGDNIEGALTVAGAVVVAGAEDQINLVASAESKGDFVELYCNGTNWFVHGVGALSGSITATDPS